MKYAVIDISSGGVSLLAAEVEKSFDVLFRERENFSVLNYTEKGNLSGRGVEKLAEILNKMKETCQKTGIEKCYVVSTASLRNFGNFKHVAAELKKRAGVTVNVLNGTEEAYCDLVSNKDYKALDNALLVDIGCGSIELCDLSESASDALECLDFGPVQINRKFVDDIHPDEREAKIVKKYVKKQLGKSKLSERGCFSTAVLVGASNRAVYEVYRDYYDETDTGGDKRIEYKKLKKLCKHLVRSSDRSMLVLKNAPEKIYTLTTSAVVLRAILKYFKVSNVVVSEFGVKEGYLSLVANGKRKGVEISLNEFRASPLEKKNGIPMYETDALNKCKKREKQQA